MKCAPDVVRLIRKLIQHHFVYILPSRLLGKSTCIKIAAAFLFRLKWNIFILLESVRNQCKMRRWKTSTNSAIFFYLRKNVRFSSSLFLSSSNIHRFLCLASRKIRFVFFFSSFSAFVNRFFFFYSSKRFCEHQSIHSITAMWIVIDLLPSSWNLPQS